MSLAISSAKEEIKEFKVGELSSLIKRVIDDNFGFIKVRGEISGIKIAASGHAYFNLKDQDAILACTCWKPIMSRVNFKLEDGLEVIATGRLSTYAGQSKYQLSVEKIEASGAGALMELLLKRKELLAKEGLFDESRKKKLPFFPSRIGVITSPVGAVLQDILHRVRDRCPATIMLWPVAVQGEACAFEVSSAINGFNNMEESLRPDVIIVARGGGSIEDLWGFNEEIVVRATANSSIPIISAIGHETDFTLIDFASSQRAPTPTAAAEFALPVISDIKARVAELESRYKNIFASVILNLKNKLNFIFKSFENLERILYPKYQRLDDLSFRLQNSLPNNLKIKSTKLHAISLPQSAIYSLLSKKETQYINLFERCISAINNNILKLNSKIELNSKLIESMSVKKILNRGFAIVRSDDGAILSSAAIAKTQRIFSIEWKDGKIQTEIK